MRLDTIMLADAATATPEGKVYIHGGGITRISAPVLPWTQPQLALFARFVMDDEDYDRSHELQLSAVDPSGAVFVPPASLQAPATPAPPGAAEGEERFMNMALGLASLTFAHEGLYRFDLRVDGDLVRSLTLVVAAARLDDQGALVVEPPPASQGPVGET